ncbi:MBL fold metallo-hydrolase [Planococcus sp. CAU13]|uniref:MBL fold metallo-hydrolase n=1 Tax=Planococcus sp. CAU13 TaxID=1541197 RepID=UPI00052FEDA6|nr:MBL fold metallo-hydrolase [Planococcus sp. CAU13]
MMEITVLGGVKEYGRNCFILTDHTTDTRIMLDCGVRNGNPEIYPAITEEIAQSIQAVFISHVHNDHIGALPLLAEKGFTGHIWMSEASLSQMPGIMGRWQTKWPGTILESLHFRSFSSCSKASPLLITEDMSLAWGYSGHMLGSVWYSFQSGEQSLFYSGDLALASPLLITDQPEVRSYDIALIDSGHSAQMMSYDKSIANILSLLENPFEKYLIPITLSGKSCDLLFFLFKALPDRDFYIEPALREHLELYRKYPDNIHRDAVDEFEAMLQSERLKIYGRTKEPGIFLLFSAVSGLQQINTGIYKNEESPFYKSHPDNEDLKTLVKTIHAEDYIFFHSRANDLEKILKSLRSDNTAQKKFDPHLNY